MKPRNTQRMRISRRLIIAAGAGSIIALVIGLTFFTNLFNQPDAHAGLNTIVSVKDGDFFSASTWEGGKLPTSRDSIVVKHKVTFNSPFTLGSGTPGQLHIIQSAALTGSGALTLAKDAVLYNYGSLSVGSLTAMGNNTRKTSAVRNAGTLSTSGVLDLKDNTVGIENSGSLTVGSKLRSSGTINNTGNLAVTDSLILIGRTSTATNQNQPAILSNGGQLSAGTIAVNSGNLLNTSAGIVTSLGDISINSGTATANILDNEGLLQVGGNLVLGGNTTGNNSDTITVGKSLTNSGNFTNEQLGFILIQSDLNNKTTGTAQMVNGGLIEVLGNFTNALGSTYGGTGGGMRVSGNSLNSGAITGTTDICDLSKTADGTVDNNSGNIASGVTSCQFGTPDALPVQMVSFTVTPNNGKAMLNWITASELNNDHFSVERSRDGRSFTAIGKVKGRGTTPNEQRYSFADPELLADGTTYYRLRQVDYNGAFEYSRVVPVRNGGAGTEPAAGVKVYPNPLQAGSTLHAELYLPEQGSVQVMLLDMNGNVLNQMQRSAAKGSTVIDIPIEASTKPGMYLLRSQIRDKVFTSKVQVR